MTYRTVRVKTIAPHFWAGRLVLIGETMTMSHTDAADLATLCKVIILPDNDEELSESRRKYKRRDMEPER